jgi:glucokinase
MAAIFAALRDAPDGTDVVLDAWWGLQPPAVVAEGLAQAGVGAVAELWCDAPPEEIGRRYAARVASRGPGHPGLGYVPELMELAARARPTGLAPARTMDTTAALDLPDLARWVLGNLRPLTHP